MKRLQSPGGLFALQLWPHGLREGGQLWAEVGRLRFPRAHRALFGLSEVQGHGMRLDAAWSGSGWVDLVTKM